MKNELINKHCPICGPDNKYDIVYKENLPHIINKADYSARKAPDNYHYEMVRCRSCKLLYANSIYHSDTINQLYEESDLNYESELSGLKKSYGNCLTIAEKLVPEKRKILDVGCGNGFVLEEALEHNWKEIFGFELSLNAISHANVNVRKKIINAPFSSHKFNNASFDLIFSAMTMEHFVDVNDFLSGSFKLLKPGGIMLLIAHNEQHFLSKILMDKHPIINDEHIYVFSVDTLELILNNHKFNFIETGSLTNYYSLSYWLKMFPLPNIMKNIFGSFLDLFNLTSLNVGIKAGNIYCIAQKPND
jgi:2-polyprenyl-3-methyl-5-hydroxy-6-metoxy-1,4-benzoquinol methylase